MQGTIAKAERMPAETVRLRSCRTPRVARVPVAAVFLAVLVGLVAPDTSRQVSAAAVTGSTVDDGTPAKTESVTGMRIGRVGDMTRVVFDLTGPIDFRYWVSRGPNLVTLVIPTTRWSLPRRPRPSGLVADFAYDGTVAPGGGLRIATEGPAKVTRLRLFKPRGKAPHRLVLELRRDSSEVAVGGTSDIPWASSPERPQWMVPRLEKPGAAVMAAVPTPTPPAGDRLPTPDLDSQDGDDELMDLFAEGEEVPGLSSGPQIDDPLEGLNRAIFTFNDGADRYFFGPIASAYGYVLPEFVKQGVRNVFANVREPVVFVNKLLQFDMEDTATSVGRFLLNSTLGLGGLIDIAAEVGLEPQKADFGQTLYHYGVDSGPYLMLPFSGPSTLRDAIGSQVDGLVNPSTYLLAFPTSLSVTGGKALVKREELGDQLDDLRANAIDFYSLVRSLYVQNRTSFLREADNLDGGEAEPESDVLSPAIDPLDAMGSAPPDGLTRPGLLIAGSPAMPDAGMAPDRAATSPLAGADTGNAAAGGNAPVGDVQTHRPLPLIVAPARGGAVWLPSGTDAAGQ